MLKKICCENFQQKEVIFNSGLNAVVGDNIATNSIGKSTILMIIDFVFGGEDYIKKNHDAVEQLGHHEFRFVFEFDNEKFFFIRNTNEYKFIAKCNEKFEITKVDKIENYTDWLQEKYFCKLEDLSFRNIVGRYFRVYGKENLNERKPIQYFEKERAAMSISALMKLFDKYKTLKAFEEQIKILKSEKVTLVDAAKKDLIPHVVTKTLFGKNEKKIVELTDELKILKRDIITASVDIEALVSKEILKLRREKSVLITKKNMLESRLIRTQTNLKNKNVNIQTELEQFVKYFPNFNIQKVQEVDRFHKTITGILKNELQIAEKDIKAQIVEIEYKITEIDENIEEKLNIKNAPQFAVDKVVEIVAQIKQLSDENGYYTKKKSIEENISTTTNDLSSLKEQALDEICNQINVKMYELNKTIYTDGRRAPNLNIHWNKYTFNTYGDTGTGTAFANLITFDLALLELTCLPAIAHDLPLLKNIENLALENIIELYSKSKKQIFIAIDKINSYSEESENIIEKHKVLQLSKDKILFIKNWKADGENK